jgi:lipid-A-disaccharide synthase
MTARRVFVSAGELSGDIAAARLIAEIRRRVPQADVFGAGGARMAAAGAEVALDTNAVGVVGVSEAIRALPEILTAIRRVRQCILERRPDVAVLIGNDIFNVLLARWLRRRGVPTIAYFPPQVWLWRRLLTPIARSFDTIVASFPEERDRYAQAHPAARVAYVGHYLADDLRAVTPEERAHARRTLGVPEGATVVAIMPGSRRSELAALTPVLLDAAATLVAHDRPWRFVVAAADTAAALPAAVARHRIAPCASVSPDSHTVLRSADLALVASGTASLEAALLGVPMVIAYKVSAITYVVARAAIALRLVGPYVVGLPNLLLGRAVVPEALQYRATPEVIGHEAWRLLSSPERLAETRAALGGIAQGLLGPRAITGAADVVLQCP